MLSLHIHAGESLLAREHFELAFVGFREGRTCKFAVAFAVAVPYTITGLAGSLKGGNSYAGQILNVEATLGSVIRIGESKITIWKAKGDSVKLAIDAPREISFCRPSQHGSSPPSERILPVASE